MTALRPAAGAGTVPPVRAPRAGPPLGGDVVLAVATFSVAVVIVLWLAGGGLQDLAGGAGAVLTSSGRVTGLVAADLLLVQVLAMARVPWVERAFGQDRLARWHRLLGFLVHPDAGPRRPHHGRLRRERPRRRPGRALGPRLDRSGHAAGSRWHGGTGDGRGHLGPRRPPAAALRVLAPAAPLRLLGVGLALPHQVWTGTDFVSSPWARAYWWSLYVAALGAVLTYRVGLPVYRTLRHRVVVTRVVQEGPGVVSLHLAGRHLHRLPAKAGQFFVWRFLDGPGWSRGHPYSLSAAPHPSMLRITVKDLGDGSRRLAGVRPGTRVLLEGPYGGLTGDRRTRHRATLMASGIGITPLRALLEELPPGATLLYRARDEAGLVLRAEIDALAAARGDRVVQLPGPRSGEGSWLPLGWGHVSGAAALRHLVPDITEQDVFVCGPEAWTDAALAALRAAGVPDAQVHVERFTY